MNFRSVKLLEAVREAPCALCGNEAEGVCAAHSNQQRHGKGTGIKAHDCFIAALCPACHHSIDQGNALTKWERADAWNRAFEDTLLWLWRSGKLKIK